MQQQGAHFAKDYSFVDYHWESEWQPYYHNEAEGLSNLDDLLMQFIDTVDSMHKLLKELKLSLASW